MFMNLFAKNIVYKRIYTYVCNDPKNTVLEGEHIKRVREREYMKNMIK